MSSLTLTTLCSSHNLKTAFSSTSLHLQSAFQLQRSYRVLLVKKKQPYLMANRTVSTLRNKFLVHLTQRKTYRATLQGASLAEKNHSQMGLHFKTGCTCIQTSFRLLKMSERASRSWPLQSQENIEARTSLKRS